MSDRGPPCHLSSSRQVTDLFHKTVWGHEWIGNSEAAQRVCLVVNKWLLCQLINVKSDAACPHYVAAVEALVEVVWTSLLELVAERKTTNIEFETYWSLRGAEGEAKASTSRGCSWRESSTDGIVLGSGLGADEDSARSTSARWRTTRWAGGDTNRTCVCCRHTNRTCVCCRRHPGCWPLCGDDREVPSAASRGTQPCWTASPARTDAACCWGPTTSIPRPSWQCTHKAAEATRVLVRWVSMATETTPRRHDSRRRAWFCTGRRVENSRVARHVALGVLDVLLPHHVLGTCQKIETKVSNLQMWALF